MAAFGPDNLKGAVAIPSQMVVGSLTHLAITFQNTSDAAINFGGSAKAKEYLMRLLGTQSTPAIIGTFENTGSTLRVAFENTCGWTAASLQAAIRIMEDESGTEGEVDSLDTTGSDVVAFVY